MPTQCTVALHPLALADCSYAPEPPQLPLTLPPPAIVSVQSLMQIDPPLPEWQPQQLLTDAAAGSYIGAQWHTPADTEHKPENYSGNDSPYCQPGGRDGTQHGQPGGGDANPISNIGGSSSGGRAKATVKHKKESVRRVNTAMLEEEGYFDMPILAAAEKLSVSIGTLKSICRSSGVKRWPYRKRNCMQRMLAKSLEPPLSIHSTKSRVGSAAIVPE